MGTQLERISQMSRENPDMVFTSIFHLINKDLLKACHTDMDGKKAVGIDGVTKEIYDSELDDNLDTLVYRLRNKSYRPKPARRVEIPKDNGKTRPLNIYCYEDKLVQDALRRVLEAVFEPSFYNEMMGFRPHRGCHDAIRLLNNMIERNNTSFVLDADIKGFFDHLDHKWIIKFVESRIKDPNVIRLVCRMLKSGIVEGYVWEETEQGSGQGAVCSPVLANIYMHYVLIWWFKEKMQPLFRGYSGIVVYADDFVACFQYKSDANLFYSILKNRMKHFGLELEEDKTRLIGFGRFEESYRKKAGKGKPETFTFLGFTHYCSTSRNGKFRVKRCTSRKKFTKKCKELNQKLKEMRNWKVKDIIAKVNQILVGYYHYYGITDNSHSIHNMRNKVIKMVFYWLNRRSQRRSYTWDKFNTLLKFIPIAPARIYVNIYDQGLLMY